MITITPSPSLASNFSAQVVVTSSGRQCHITIDSFTRVFPALQGTSSAFSRTPTCLIESNIPFTTNMHYGDRQYPDQLPVIQYAGEYSCAFPLWSDATIQVQCEVLNFVLYGSAVQPALPLKGK